MMLRLEPLLLGVVLEHREVDHPEELPALPLHAEAVGQGQAQRAQAGLGHGLGVGHEEQ